MAFDHQSQRQLLAAALADQEAEAPRLIYADWLEDQGDPLAELVRVQVALAREDDDLVPRERQLRAGFGFDRPARRPRARFGEPGPIFQDWTYQIARGLVSLCLHQLPPAAPALPQPPAAWLERF